MTERRITGGRWRRPQEYSRRDRLEPLERQMRERNLSTGSGCKATARAIEYRAVQAAMRAAAQGRAERQER